jgi:hypothetical protein
MGSAGVIMFLEEGVDWSLDFYLRQVFREKM